MWSPIDWGNIGFVYAGAMMRMAFMAGVGLDTKRGQELAEKAASKKSR